MDAFRPENFMLLPTMACQAGCRYCFAKKTGEVMTRETAEKTLDFMACIAPERKDIHLTFHGGEPLLAGEEFYEWILPLLWQRFGRRVHLSIQSNLWAVTGRMAELFRKYHVSVGTSLDGPEDICDSQRGEGYYARTTAGMELLKKHRVGAGAICTITKPNAGRAEEVFRKSKQPYALHGAVPMLHAPSDKMSLSTEEMRTILVDSYEAYKKNPEHNRITTIDSMAKGCLDGRGHTCTFFDCLGAFAAIAPDGGVYSCQRFCGMEEYCLGNIRENLSKEAILNSLAFALLRSIEEGKQTTCGDCAHFAYCRGGCLYNTITGEGNKDPYCEAYRAAFDKIGMDMALEMGQVMLGQNKETPVLAMADDHPHPYEQKQSRARMRLAVEKGLSTEPFAANVLRNPYPEHTLNKLYLHLTFDCPLHCTHCYADGGERKTEEMLPGRLAAIIQEAADRGFHSVVITGGEPLVYSGFDELCRLLEKTERKGTKLILRSSFGFPIPEERMKAICELFDEIVVSVDGNREIHDARRGAGRYEASISNLERAGNLGYSEKLGLAAVLTIGQTEGTAGKSVRDLAHRLQINKIRFRPMLPMGRGKGAEQEQWQLCSEELGVSEDFRLRYTCGLGQNLYVEPNGDSYPCYAWCASDKKLGNLNAETLGELLDRGELFEYCRHDVDTNEKCRTCEVRYICGGICKAWVNDKENVDSGDFDCSSRKKYFLQLAEKITSKQNDCSEVTDEHVAWQDHCC